MSWTKLQQAEIKAIWGGRVNWQGSNIEKVLEDDLDLHFNATAIQSASKSTEKWKKCKSNPDLVIQH